MEDDSSATADAWTLLYLVASVPVLLFYSAALSGWYYDYPMWLFIPISLLLAIPLLLILMQSPQAARWNITMLKMVTSLVILRIASGLFLLATPRRSAAAERRGDG